MTVPIATRILIANVRHIGLSNICVINLVYFNAIQFNSMVYSHNTVQYAYNICTSYNTMYK